LPPINEGGVGMYKPNVGGYVRGKGIYEQVKITIGSELQELGG